MTPNPKIVINLDKVQSNTKTIVQMCGKHNVEVFGVTKGVCGDINIAKAMLRGGVKGLADARLDNIKTLKLSGIKAPIMMLRSPMVSEIEEVVKYTDISLNSEPTIIELLSESAQNQNVIHDIILMIDVGEIREGIIPANVRKITRQIKGLPGIRVVGTGTNLACYSGVIPTRENMHLLLYMKKEIEEVLQYPLKVVSGGNSSNLELIESGELPKGINQLRIGESILLGRSVQTGKPIAGTYQDVFSLTSEIIELKKKPSVPLGELGESVFGDQIDEEPRIHYRGIAALGRQDVPPDALIPIQKNHNDTIEVIGATSDHTLIDLGSKVNTIQVGSEVKFNITYPGLLAAITSPYVNKEYTRW